jgi:hypothetical protein
MAGHRGFGIGVLADSFYATGVHLSPIPERTE